MQNKKKVNAKLNKGEGGRRKKGEGFINYV